MSKEKNELIKKLETVLEENGKMLKMMGAEFTTCLSLVEGNPESEELRRISVRTLFSNIEAICNRLKLSLLPFFEALLKKEEIAMINEESYYLKDNGEASERKVYPKFTSNLQFAFKVFTRVTGSEFELDTGSKEWEEFIKAVEIRNRITHPKNLSDMKISEDDFEKATDAYDWFLENIGLLRRSYAR